MTGCGHHPAGACVTIESQIPVDDYASGWELAFGRSLTTERDWLLRRSTTLMGAVDCQGELVAGLGFRRAVLEDRQRINVRLLHDLWVHPEHRRGGVFTTLAREASRRHLAAGADAVLAIASRARGTRRGFESAGFAHLGPVETMRGPVTPFLDLGEPRSSVDRVIVTASLAEFGYDRCAGLFEQRERVVGQVGLRRDAQYFRERFDEAPRAYLAAGALSGTASGRLDALCIAKVWAKRSCLQVLAAAGTATPLLAATSALVRHAITDAAVTTVDISAPGAEALGPAVAGLGLVPAPIERDIFVRAAPGVRIRGWEVFRDEINSF
ncbi:GNAT family N-acetyltransferase [Kribbella sp. NPDC051718]|uniref:GNAT family N-acetyltransferase n=1 Tax=Kribbella sp. NPDC051718 TaxID=3155168 RepID=UPI00344A19C7